MSRLRRARGVPILAALLACLACQAPGSARTPAAITVPAPAEVAAADAAVALPPDASVFVVVMENLSAAQALSQPYTSELAGRFAVATDYHAIGHPSLPNYIALTSGSTFGITDDDYHPLPVAGIGDQLTRHGVSWRAYMEGLGGGTCTDDHGRYAVRHDPFAYYGGACPSNVVGFEHLNEDLTAGTPRFVWITPDVCHDGHDCKPRTADDFLAQLVPRILDSPAWTAGGALFLTWDEDDGSGDNRVAMIVASPRLKAHTTARPYNHYSTLATVEDLLRVPRLGEAAHARTFDDVLP